MKVVQINAVLNGSTGKIAKDISQMLNKKGIENYILFADGASENNNEIKISSTFSMKIHAFLSRLLGKQACFSNRKTKKMLKLLDKISPDVVHLHNLHHNYVNLNLLLKYLAKKDIKTVLTLHDCWFFTGKCTHYVSAGCNKWQTGCGNCPQLKKDNPSWFFDRTNKLFLRKKKLFSRIKKLETVAVSCWMKSQAEKSFLKDSNLHVVHNGINLDLFTPNGENFKKSYDLEDKKVVLVMANKCLSYENQGLLDYLCKELPEEYAILMVGGNVEKDRVYSVDYVKDINTMARVYRTADVFLNVSHEDSLPTVNIEAMACGVPVVTYEVGGSTEIITKATGRVVKEYDLSQLVKEIKEVCSLDKNVVKENCRKHVEENYDNKKQYLEYYDIYLGVK